MTSRSSSPTSQCLSTRTVTDTIVQFQTVAEQGIFLTNYNAITHPSQPNYVAGSNLGIIDVFDLLEQKGFAWKTYNEDPRRKGSGLFRIWTKRKHDKIMSRLNSKSLLLLPLPPPQTNSTTMPAGSPNINLHVAFGDNMTSASRLDGRQGRSVTRPSPSCNHT